MSWDRELEGGLPDCRLTGHRRRATTMSLGGVLMERVFCANCGADGGLVTADWSPHVFYVCDKCETVGGKLALPEVPDDVVRGR
jgi:hypothetical protein